MSIQYIHVYLLKPHFYIEKTGVCRVYLFFLFLLQNIDCWYSLEPPRRGGSNVYQQSYVLRINKKYIYIKKSNEILDFLQPNKFCIFDGQVFVIFQYVFLYQFT